MLGENFLSGSDWEFVESQSFKPSLLKVKGGHAGRSTANVKKGNSGSEVWSRPQVGRDLPTGRKENARLPEQV